jgi:hypothetical protein
MENGKYIRRGTYCAVTRIRFVNEITVHSSALDIYE